MVDFRMTSNSPSVVFFSVFIFIAKREQSYQAPEALRMQTKEQSEFRLLNQI